MSGQRQRMSADEFVRSMIQDDAVASLEVPPRDPKQRVRLAILCHAQYEGHGAKGETVLILLVNENRCGEDSKKLGMLD